MILPIVSNPPSATRHVLIVYCLRVSVSKHPIAKPQLLKSPSRKCVEIPFLAEAMLPSAEAAPLHAEAVPLHAEVMPLQDTLSTPDFTGIAITLNTPFCLHRL